MSHINVSLSDAQEEQLASRMGAAIAHVPGKNEQGLLLAFDDECRLRLAGKNNEPIAFVEADVFANESHAGYESFVAELVRAFQEVIGIPPGRVYVRFADIPVWSVGSMVVDRRMFG